MNPVVTVTGFWDAFITKIAVFLPNLLFAIAIILLGWVVCNVIKRVVVRVLKFASSISWRSAPASSRSSSAAGCARRPRILSACWRFGFFS